MTRITDQVAIDERELRLLASNIPIWTGCLLKHVQF
jgi:hypothetical protein